MIGRIRGVLLEKQAPILLVDVQGIAYEVQAPMSTFYQLPDINAEVVLHTHLVVREDAHLLYGFFELRERTLFRTLIKVSGVGPKLGLTILSGMAVEEFVKTIRNNDVAAMVKMPGVGKKTAERLIVEMRDRLKDWHVEEGLADSVTGSNENRSAERNSQEAETALIALGYKPTEAARSIAQVLRLQEDDVSSSEELIRLALKSMA